MDGKGLSGFIDQLYAWFSIPWFTLGDTPVSAGRLFGLFIIISLVWWFAAALEKGHTSRSTVDDKPAPPPADEPEALESMDVEFIEDALPMDAALEAEGPMEFPSRVLRAEPLDPIMLAYLLEDDA